MPRVTDQVNPTALNDGAPPLALTLRKNVLWLFAGKGTYAATQWGILIALAKLGSPEILGRYTLALAVTAPVILFCDLKLREVQATETENRHGFGDYLALRTVTVALALFLILTIVFSSNYSRQTALVILAVGLCKGVESVSDIFFGLMQRQERMDYIAVSLLLKGLLSLGAMTTILYLWRDLLWAVVAMAAVWFGMLVFFDARNAAGLLTSGKMSLLRRGLYPRFDWRELFLLAELALPLGLGGALVSLNTNIPRYLLERFHGEAALGYFAAMAYVPATGMIAIEALGQSALPRLARFYREDWTAYMRLLVKLMALAATLGSCNVLVAFLFGPDFLTLVYRPEYAHYSQVFVWIMVASAMLYLCSILGVALTAARFLKVQLLISFMAALGSLLAALWLVPMYAERGAAGSFLIGCGVWLLVSLPAVIHVAIRARWQNAFREMAAEDRICSISQN